jgi:hypothetical protein
MLLKFYQAHLQKYLTPSQFLVMTTLLSLMQSEKQVRLERLSRVFPCLITAESRRRKLQRFLDLPNLRIELIWFPLITYWLTTYCPVGTRLSIAIDRSREHNSYALSINTDDNLSCCFEIDTHHSI